MITEPSAATAAACGPSLEYEPDYLLLLARLAPGVEVQYGSFVGGQDTPDWTAIEREARRLLARSQDIVLWAGVCRAAVRMRRAAGLADALAELNAVLAAWPDAVHPQVWFDGEFDPVPRANALALLADPQGLLGDVRALLAEPLDAAQQRSISRAAAEWARLLDWTAHHLPHDAPDLLALSGLLAELCADRTRPQTAAPAMAAARPHEVAPPSAVTAAATVAAALSRSDMRAVLAQARGWFEQHEPSSPVAVLLLYAEHLVGKPFAELVDAIPPDCLRKWQGLA